MGVLFSDTQARRILRAARLVESIAGSGASSYGSTVGEGESTTPPPRRNSAKNSDSIDVWVTQTGGSAGDESTQCSFTYSIYPWSDPTKAGTAIATSVAMQGNGHRVLNATMTAGSLGRARQVSGTWKLLWVDEKFQQTNCT